MIIFSDFINIFQRPLVFSSSTDQILAVWLALRCVTLWGVFSDLGWKSTGWKSNFSLLQGLFWYFGNFIRFSWFFSNSFNLSQLWRENRGCLINIKVYQSWWAYLGLWIIVQRNSHFSILHRLFQRPILAVWLVLRCVALVW